KKCKKKLGTLYFFTIFEELIIKLKRQVDYE
ncbi:MAG: hypothetical protein ACI86L_000250, partial [Dokdonia sp.]